MKTKGDSGNDIKQVIGNSLTMIGADNVNLLPSFRVDPNGYTKINIDTSTTQGMMNIPSVSPQYQAVDNASDHHTGNYTLVAFNKIVFESAAGGINFSTPGNINFLGASLISFAPSECVSVFTKNVRMVGLEEIILDGIDLNVKNRNIQFMNTVKMDKNLLVNGGVLINGELYVSHITGPINGYPTSTRAALKTYFYPGTKLSGTIYYDDPATGNAAEINVTFELDESTTHFAQGYTEPHRHLSLHIATDLKESPDEIWKDAEDLKENIAKGAKKNEPFGDAIENIIDGTIEVLGNALTDTATQAFTNGLGL